MQGRAVAIVVGAIALAVALLALFGGGMMGMVCPGCPGAMGWGGFGWSWGWIMMLFFWLLIVGGAALLVTWLIRQQQPAETAPGGSRALDILRERYARGEITREQYEQMRHDLGGP